MFPSKATSFLTLCLYACNWSSSAIAKPEVIEPGTVWRDTQGQIIQAHGGGIMKLGETYYWFGEDKTEGASFQNVKCYSSRDLKHWKFESNAISRQPGGDLGPNRIVERPKVLFNRSTGKYIMYMHIDSPDYSDARIGVATSSRVTGPYTYLKGFRPQGHQSRDMTLFQDEDGTGYLIYEDRERGIAISRLSPDYLSVEIEVAMLPKAMESPAMLKVGGLYYLLGSNLTGWDTNPNFYTSAKSLAGPWSEFKSVAPASKNTYNSQSTYLLAVTGNKTTSYLYLGDRWKKDRLTDSRYIWMPVAIDNGSMLLQPDQPWTLDIKTGEIGEVKWKAPLPEGDYRISDLKTGRSLSVEGFPGKPGTRVVGSSLLTTQSAQWHLRIRDNAYEFRHLESGQVLEIFGESTAENAPLGMWTANGGLHQSWRLEPQKNGRFVIVNRNSDLKLGLQSGLNGPNSPVIQGSGSSLWKFEPVVAHK